MGELFGFLIAGLIVACFVALGAYLVFLVGATSATMRAARHDRLMRQDLDRVLDEVLGPRSEQQRSI